MQRLSHTIPNNLGRKHTPEWSEKIALTKRGKPLSIKHKKRISDGLKRISSEVRIKIKASLPRGEKHWNWGGEYALRGENHNNWKGSGVGYRSLHAWVVRYLGKPQMCEHCKRSNLSGHLIHWANKSHKYKRNLTDWIRLCASCHGAYDRNKLELV